MCNCTRNWSKWREYFAYWSRKNVFPWKGLTALGFSYLFSAYTDIHLPFPNKHSNHGSSPWPCVTGDKDAWLYQGALQVNWMSVWEEEAAHVSPVCLYPATSLSTLLALHCFEKSQTLCWFNLFLRSHWRLCQISLSYLHGVSQGIAGWEAVICFQTVLYPWVVLPSWLLYLWDLLIAPPPHYLLHSALPKMRPQLCKPKIAYCVFAQHLARGLWARASFGDWKASNRWQSWLNWLSPENISQEKMDFFFKWKLAIKHDPFCRYLPFFI